MLPPRVVSRTPGLLPHHPRAVPEEHREEIDGIPAVSLVWALLQVWSGLRSTADRRALVCEAVVDHGVDPHQLLLLAARLKRLRARAELHEACRLVRLGCHSPLEMAYYLLVEVAHRLPAGARQHPVRLPDGSTVVVDVLYGRVVVELQGAWHASTPEERAATQRRAMLLRAVGYTVLFFGWDDVHRTPALVAATVRSHLG